MEGYVKLTATPCEDGCEIEQDVQLEHVSIEGKAMLLESFLEAIEMPQDIASLLCQMLNDGVVGRKAEM